jgi:hypothetical protein
MKRVPASELACAEDGLTYHGSEPFTGVKFELRADGTLAGEVELREGLRSGMARGWYPNGKLAEAAHYLLDVAHGLWREWEVDGTLVVEQEHELGILLWAREYDGELKETYRLQEGDPDFETLQQLRARYGVVHEASWAEALELLCQILPGVELVGERISTAKLERLIYERMPEKPWIRLTGDEDLDIFDELAPHLATVEPHSFGVLVVDWCYRRNRSPFKLRLEQMRELIGGFCERYQDEVFGGDALLLFEDRCVFVHHEGYFMVLERCRQA